MFGEEDTLGLHGKKGLTVRDLRGELADKGEIIEPGGLEKGTGDTGTQGWL